MIGFLWRATQGYRLRPWKSPYLRWRLETYWGVPEEEIDFREFWRLSWRLRHDVGRFAAWAERMRP